MKYVVEVAKSQAEQKRIEAQGIADYNRTVASSLTAAVLEFRRSEALSALATSANAKTVVLGSSATTPVTIHTESK